MGRNRLDEDARAARSATKRASGKHAISAGALAALGGAGNILPGKRSRRRRGGDGLDGATVFANSEPQMQRLRRPEDFKVPQAEDHEPLGKAQPPPASKQGPPASKAAVAASVAAAKPKQRTGTKDIRSMFGWGIPTAEADQAADKAEPAPLEAGPVPGVGNPQQQRASKYAKAGALSKALAVDAARLRHDRKQSAADAKMAEAAAVAVPGKQPADAQQADKEARVARAATDQVWASVGTVDAVTRVMAKMQALPEMREIKRTEQWQALMSDLHPERSSDHRAREMIVSSVQEFLKKLGGTGGGQHAEDDNAMDAALASLVGSKADMVGLKAAYRRVLDVGGRRLDRAIKARAKLWDADDGHWRRAKRKEHRNRYPEEGMRLLSDFLHDVCTYDNGTNRRPVKVVVGTDPDGAVVYDEHSPMKLPGSLKHCYDLLTGRDRTKPKVSVEGHMQFPPRVGAQPHPIWLQLEELHKTKDKGAWKCSAKQLRKALCPCMARAKEKKCVCRVCHQFQEDLALFRKSSPQWLSRWLLADASRDADAVTAKERSCLTSTDAFLDATMCDKVDVPALALSQYHPKTGRLVPGAATPFAMHKPACVVGGCKDCKGWDKLYGHHPTHVVGGEDDDDDHDADSVSLRGHPSCYTAEPMAWMEWRKVSEVFFFS